MLEMGAHFLRPVHINGFIIADIYIVTRSALYSKHMIYSKVLAVKDVALVIAAYPVKLEHFHESIRHVIVGAEQTYESVVGGFVGQGRVHGRVGEMGKVPIGYDLSGVYRSWNK